MSSGVLIIGGGVIGLSLARALHKKGVRSITIIERGEIGREASFAAAGILAPQAEADSADDFFRFCSASNALYSEFAAELFDETGVDIELDSHGTLYLAFNEKDSAEIQKRFEWQKRAGLAVERLTAEETRKAEPLVSPYVRESLFFPSDRQVENRKLLIALRKYSELNEIEIRENTTIESVSSVRTGSVIEVETNAGRISADTVVLTTGAWTSLIQAGEFVLPQVKPIKGQMISYASEPGLIRKVIYSPQGYLVPRADGRILAGATVEDAGFDKSVTADGVAELERRALEIAPALANFEIRESWAGLRPFATDGLPVLGEVAKNILIATAHYRNGILLAPLTAEIMAERITGGEDSEYLGTFGPRRFQVSVAQA